MQMIQFGDYNINIWKSGANNEWYEYRLEKFNANDHIVMDKIVRVVADETSRRFIDSRDFARHVDNKLRSGVCVRMIPNPPFLVQRI